MSRRPSPTNTDSPAQPPFPLADAYARSRARLGHQDWWPGETPFEVCLGAILTQNTAWTNVERALRRLATAGLLEPRALHAVPEAELAEWLRPAGAFRVKARRLRAFLTVLFDEYDGSLARLFDGDTASVRSRLLAIHGIGPETADCLLLYAGGHLSFVVDAYTRRILSRHGWCGAADTYGEIQTRCAAAMPTTGASAVEALDRWQDCHAQLVSVAKHWCRAGRPDCETCPLRPLLPGGRPVT